MNTADPPRHWSICLPAPGSSLARVVRPGSAIVARPDPGADRLVADFEGNLYGAANLGSYVERLICAAWRSRELAPTVARHWVEPAALDVIGELDLGEDGTFWPRVDPEREEDLARWLGIGAEAERAWRDALPAALAWSDRGP